MVAERVSITATDARHASETAESLHARVESIGTELTNQLNELGQEIDSLAALREADGADAADPPEVAVSDELIAALRTGQAKLANEQARYEIAFREDLAVLAEQVRQLRGRG